MLEYFAAKLDWEVSKEGEFGVCVGGSVWVA